MRHLLLGALCAVLLFSVSCAPKIGGRSVEDLHPVDMVTTGKKPCFIASFPRPVVVKNDALVMDKYTLSIVRYPSGSRKLRRFSPPITRYRQDLVLDQPVLPLPGKEQWSVIALEASSRYPDTVYLTGRIAMRGRGGIAELVFRTVAPDLFELEPTGIATWNRSEIGNEEIVDMGFVLERIASTMEFVRCR